MARHAPAQLSIGDNGLQGVEIAMKLRRCAIVFFEIRESVEFVIETLFAGGDGLSRTQHWVAIAPHLDGEVIVALEQREFLGTLSPSSWIDGDALDDRARSIARLLIEAGLVISDERISLPTRRRDEAVRSAHWWPLAAVGHRMARWKGVDSVSEMESNKLVTAQDFRGKLGAPPPAVKEMPEGGEELKLTSPPRSSFDDLLGRRTTCRNFDERRGLEESVFATMMKRVFGAQAIAQPYEDTIFLKKTSPSGGGLHSIGAYVMVRNVTGVARGLYDYHPLRHSLRAIETNQKDLDGLALRVLAGQHWFAQAPVLVFLIPRYARSFWKYRHHAKAYRALVLDGGHLSQTMYLSATELGLGAFITSAINEVDIEEAFSLNSLAEGPIAACGFGYRCERMTTTEFDPGHVVWSDTPRKDGLD